VQGGQPAGETGHALLAGRVKAGHGRIVGNQIDLAGEFGRQPAQRCGILLAVVETREEDIFEGRPAPGFFGVILDRVEEFGQGVTFGHRDDLPAFRVDGGMERDGEAIRLPLLRIAHNGRGDADRGDDDMAVADGDPISVVDEAGRGHDGFIIEQGLTHAHKDDVGRQFTGLPRRLQHLIDDLAGGQVAFETQGAGGAKGAAESAADL